jgi:hypothetical protein
MKCKKCKEDIVLLLYGELADKDKSEVMEHIKGCPECAEELESTKGVFAVLDETKEESAPEADWERCWGAIQTDIVEGDRGEKSKGRSRSRERERRFFMRPGWIYAAASVVVIFVLGVFIGRFWLTSDVQTTAAVSWVKAPGSSEYIKQSLREHFETLKPMLVSYANYSVEENGREMMTLDKEIVKNLLIQNYLLKKLVIESDPSAAELLDDLDLVLREIKNMPSDDTWATSQVKEFIQERDILFKMDILKTL